LTDTFMLSVSCVVDRWLDGSSHLALLLSLPSYIAIWQQPQMWN